MSKETLLFVGPSGAGKDTVVDRITLLTGAVVTSLSSQVRKEARKIGMTDPRRSDLQIFANQMRLVHGNNVFAKLAADDIKQNVNSITIVNGVRHPDEINVFDDPIVIGVDASKETRFHRVLARGRHSDPNTWSEFLVCDERENGTPDGKDGQQNYQCLAKADLVIQNESNSLEQIEYIVDLLVDRLVRTGNLKCITGISKTETMISKKRLVITNGIHGAGKTTIGRMVAEKLAIPHREEVGGRLRHEVDYNVLQSSIDFDREVMRRELLRDHELLRDASTDAFIVETWHTGNIAYALQRSPDIATSYIEQFRKLLPRFDAMSIFFLIDSENFRVRSTEKVLPEEEGQLLNFFTVIAGNTRFLYRSMGLIHNEIDNNGDLETTSQRVLTLVSEYLDI